MYVSLDFYRNNSIYLSCNVGIIRTSKLAPYALEHFTKFGFTEHFGSFAHYRPISNFSTPRGGMFNCPATADVYSQIRNAIVMKGEDDYFKKSKRQKNIG